jgi:glycosyltransferase involved in cell wall biosynthesis
MRVLHLVKTAVGGTWALRQMGVLKELGIDVHVAIPNGPLTEHYRRVGITVHEADVAWPVRSPWRVPALVRNVSKLVRQVQPDIIHSHFVTTTLTMRMALGRDADVPRVFQVPGPLHLEHPVFRAAELATAGTADYWIGSCQWTRRRYMASGISADRVFLSYYGTELNRAIASARPSLPVELTNGRSPVIGMVAYMYAPKRYLGQARGLKGHEDLIDALDLCRQQIPELTGVFVGGAWNGATWYERRVAQYGRSRHERNLFLGDRPDVAALYNTFDVAVCPSHSENVGGAVESLLCGVPTVTTNVGGFPDLVIDGETGWLVPPKNPEALAAAILEAIGDRDRARRRALAGQQRARRMFNVEQTAAEIADIYRRILAHRAMHDANETSGNAA